MKSLHKNKPTIMKEGYEHKISNFLRHIDIFVKIIQICMTNNDILKKLRVALQLKDTDIVDIMALVDFKVTKSSLT